ncbi:hypothetical protein DFH09DRAFT_1371424 [Mycena vulgaris]|nr:hypothetical protein DFH09DRAFT_1371424 [Mycena vulgaris]
MIDPNGYPTPPPAPSFTDTHPPAPWAHPSRYHRRALLLRPRALLLIAAGALTLVALGPTVGLPVPDSSAEYDHGPPPPRPPPPSADAHTDDSDAALTALHTAQPPSLAVARALCPQDIASPAARLRRLLRLRPRPRARVPRHCVHADFAPFWQVSGPQQEARPTQGRGGRVEGFGEVRQLSSSLNETDEAHVSLARAILARIDHSAYGPAGRGASSNNHGNYGSAHSTPPPTLVSAHKVPGAINAGPAGMAIGSTRGVVFPASFPSFSLRAPWLSFRPSSLLSSCCAELECRGGVDGAVAHRRGRDGGIAVACSHCDPREAPHTSSAHIVVAPPHLTPDGRPRLRVAYAAYALSRSYALSLQGCAYIIARRRACARSHAALCICVPAASLFLLPAHHALRALALFPRLTLILTPAVCIPVRIRIRPIHILL